MGAQECGPESASARLVLHPNLCGHRGCRPGLRHERAYHVSNDGGKTFEAKYAPTGITMICGLHPKTPSRLIIADDGGAQVSYDAG